MRYAPERHHRHSIRLKNYDYTRMGAYFVTLCTRNRTCLFREIVAGEMRLNEYGEMVAESWRWLATQYDYVELDEWVVMPNHLHGIIVITGGDRKGSGGTDGSDGRSGDGDTDGFDVTGGSRGRAVREPPYHHCTDRHCATATPTVPNPPQPPNGAT
ncbi:transposase [Chloracidobacterium thermophilum]|uniref:transposase n=1 Tax=Chloracidobacterium thermophilum TaxID=458033 RepID=UPI000B2AAE57|nr:transposase [Chloracidobacterium thermophilum]